MQRRYPRRHGLATNGRAPGGRVAGDPDPRAPLRAAAHMHGRGGSFLPRCGSAASNATCLRQRPQARSDTGPVRAYFAGALSLAITRSVRSSAGSAVISAPAEASKIMA